MNKRVCHVITTLGLGGAEKQLLTLVRRQRENGWTVKILFLKGPTDLEEEFMKLNCGVYSLRNILQFRIKAFLNPNYLRSFIFHAHLPRAEILTLVISRVLGLTFVSSRHNTEYFYPEGPKLISRVLSRLVIKYSKAVICISRAVRDSIIQNKEVLNEDTFKLITIYYGIESRIIFKKQNSKESDGIFRLGCMARLVKQKDIPTLLFSFAQVLKTNSSVLQIELIIVGDGPQKRQLMKLSQQLEISNEIKWISKISETNRFFESIDLFVLPSLYEGFGLVLLEAMLSDTPILASRTTAIPEVLGENYSGLFAVGDVSELTKKIQDCLSTNYRKTLTDSYSQRLAFFSASRSCEEISNLYIQIQAEEVN